MFVAGIYSLCLLTSLGCATLLIVNYRRNATRLALWTAACFVLLAISNLLVVIDVLILPSVNLLAARKLTSLMAAGILVVGFIWEAE